MRTGLLLAGWLLSGALAAAPAIAQTAVPSPTPAEPGRSATEGVTSDTTPPAKIDPVQPPAGAPPAGVPPMAGAPPATTPASAAGGMSAAEIRELISAVQATAKATREAVDYSRVTPDLLTQILAKLDKLEDKLDKVENAIRAGQPGRRR